MATGEVTTSNLTSQSWSNIYETLNSNINSITWYPSRPEGNFTKSSFPIGIVRPIQPGDIVTETVGNVKVHTMRTRLLLTTTSAKDIDTQSSKILKEFNDQDETFLYDYNMDDVNVRSSNYFPERWGDIDVHTLPMLVQWTVRLQV